ncbi:extracellular solute-binding protein [Paenibacillus thermoaerophilus]|uniref:Extracellular solute-binding protein n=1 Tax=Paenibacillus thermoaerophilus TaxID=1215385 RepID=A0ABW2V2S0_9BACL|nr:extracellular solute-binding protein [Paenibacillus thermoaerophilus]TMV14369.1 extracellular solute-binding protein [Paenibacillus thermoaerophilus]
MMKTKKGLPVAMVMALAVAAAGCGGDSDDGSVSPAANASSAPTVQPAEPAKEFKMTIRHINVRETSKNTLALLQEVAKKTEAEVPGLKFELDGVEDTVNRDQKLKAEMAAGNPPPIFNLFGGDDTKNYSKAGRLLDLTPIIQELGLSDKFLNLGEFTVDGKVYGLPEAGYVEGFFYNTKMFADAGVQVPTTWDEFLQVCEALKAKGITPIALGGGGGDAWAINMLVNSMFVRHGGVEIQEGFTTGKTKWTDKPVVDGLKMLDELKQKGYLDKNAIAQKYAEGQAKFYTGQAAMLFDGTWAIAGITGESSTIKDNVGFFNFPNVGGPGDNTINGGFSNGYGFSSKLNENELKAVKAFIKNYYTEANQKLELAQSGRIPSMKLSDTGDAKGLIVEAVKVQNKQKAAFPAFDSLVQASVKKTLEEAVEELVGGKITPEQAAEKVQKAQEEANKAQ